jgi:hypothetical protein
LESSDVQMGWFRTTTVNPTGNERPVREKRIQTIPEPQQA